MDTNVVIVGAGPAGLAVGACLRRAGVDFIMLEKAAEVAPAWRRHYRRLHLHTVKSFSSLPFVPFPGDHPRYVPRERRRRARCARRQSPQCFALLALPSLTAMRLALAWARLVFGSVTVSTPLRNVALTLSSSTSQPSAMRRSKRP